MGLGKTEMMCTASSINSVSRTIYRPPNVSGLYTSFRLGKKTAVGRVLYSISSKGVCCLNMGDDVPEIKQLLESSLTAAPSRLCVVGDNIFILGSKDTDNGSQIVIARYNTKANEIEEICTVNYTKPEGTNISYGFLQFTVTADAKRAYVGYLHSTEGYRADCIDLTAQAVLHSNLITEKENFRIAAFTTDRKGNLVYTIEYADKSSNDYRLYIHTWEGEAFRDNSITEMPGVFLSQKGSQPATYGTYDYIMLPVEEYAAEGGRRLIYVFDFRRDVIYRCGDAVLSERVGMSGKDMFFMNQSVVCTASSLPLENAVLLYLKAEDIIYTDGVLMDGDGLYSVPLGGNPPASGEYYLLGMSYLRLCE